MLDFSHLPVIRQSETSECGIACLCMVASYHGKRYDLPSLRRRFPLSIQGATLADLVRIGGELDFSTRALRVEIEALKGVRLPAILHWDFSHFVVLKSISRGHAVIHDPAQGERRLALAEFGAGFTGVVLEMTPMPRFQRERHIQRLRITDVLANCTGILAPVLHVLALSLAIQVIAIITPFYSQLAIDKVVPSGDTSLLRVLALGFGVFFVLEPIVSWMRTRVVILFSTQLSAQMTTAVVRALLDLPLPFFEKRSIGDILTRLEAAERLRDLLAEGFVAILVDALLAILTLAMMAYYSPTLAGIVVVVAALTAIQRLIFVPILRRGVADQLQKQGREQSELIETLRGITSVKFAQKEREREALWGRSFSDLVNAISSLALVQANFELVQKITQNIGYVVMVYLAIGYVIDGENTFTVGAFFAFMAYQSMFFHRVEDFLGQMIQLSMTRVHLERLSEIVFEEPEEPVREVALPADQAFSLEMENLGFTYDSDTEPLFDGLTARVDAGQRIAISAPSGTGKTTLLKVLTGVYPATSGKLSVNGMRVRKSELKTLRRNVAAVLQDDYLFKGSISDNITFFNPSPDPQRVMNCAKLACVHDEIMGLPMNYEAFVGEMGSSLSRGQQQRVLIARALYQEKPLLVLDEGTANLDGGNESRLLENLAGLDLTLIYAAHSSAALRHATHIWRLDDQKRLTIEVVTQDPWPPESRS